MPIGAGAVMDAGRVMTHSGVGAGARSPNKNVLAKADVPRAQRALDELKVIAAENKIKKFGWNEVRKGSITDWLKKDGMLGNKNWQDDPATREYISNAQKRAGELGQVWAEKIKKDFGLTDQDVLSKPTTEIVALAKQKGMNLDPATPDGLQNLDLLTNGHEVGKELIKKAMAPEALQKQLELEQAAEAADVAMQFPDAADLMLGIVARESLDKALTKRAQRIMKQGIKIEGGQAKVVDAKKIAIAVDMQIAAIKWNLAIVETMMVDAQGKRDSATSLADLQKKRDDLLVRVTKLADERSKGQVEVELDNKKYRIQDEQIRKLPDQMVDLAVRLGCDEENAKNNPIATIANVIPKSRRPEEVNPFVTKMSKLCNLNVNQEAILRNHLLKGPPKNAKEKSLYIAKYGGGGIGILFILALWSAAKQKEGPGG